MPRTRSLAWSELKLGIVGVIALVLLTMVVLAVGGEGGFWTDRYPLKTRFADVQGLKPGAVVRLSGKEVGTVTSVEFAGPEIEVLMAVRSDVRSLLTTEATASLGALSLLGDPIVDLQASDKGTPLADWAYVRSTGVSGPLGELTEQAEAGLAQATTIFADLQRGQGTLGKLLTDDTLYVELNRLITSASSVAGALTQGRGTLGQLMQDPSAYAALKASLEQLQTATARINNAQGPLGRLLGDEAMGKSLSGTVSNLEQVTGRLTSSQGSLGRLINDAEFHDRVSRTTGRLDELIAGLQAGEGTMGQLLRDRQLYESINGAVTELRALVADIRRDPKKYLRVQVSIF